MPIWGYILILVGAVVIVAGVVVTIIAATKRKKTKYEFILNMYGRKAVIGIVK